MRHDVLRGGMVAMSSTHRFGPPSCARRGRLSPDGWRTSRKGVAHLWDVARDDELVIYPSAHWSMRMR